MDNQETGIKLGLRLFIDVLPATGYMALAKFRLHCFGMLKVNRGSYISLRANARDR